MQQRKFSNIFRALKYRNYKLYFIGQTISFIGTWMQRVAIGWLIYRVTKDSSWLGTMDFASLFSACFFAPVAGLLADRWNCKNIFIASQFLAMIQAFALGILLFYSSKPSIYIIIALCFLLGVSNGFEFPTRQAFVVELVDDKEDLSNAIALNSLIFNGTRLLGPPIAGFLIAIFDEGTCFWINGISYIAVIVMLFMMNTKEIVIKKNEKKMLTGLMDGIKYSWNYIPIRISILLLFFFSFSGLPIITFLPVFANDVLHGNSKTLGYLMGGSGVGACIGGIVLIFKTKVKGLEKNVEFSTLFYGLALILFSISKNFYLSVFLMSIIGYNMIIIWVATNTLIQELVDDSMRGRVMSFYIMTFMGAMPLGSLTMGFLSKFYPLVDLMLIGGIITVIIFLIYKKYNFHIGKALLIKTSSSCK